MKKILFLSLALIGLSFESHAQYTVPRTTNATVLVSTADAAGADTIKLVPTEKNTLVVPSAIVDSVVYTIKRTTGSYVGDKLTFLFTNEAASGNYIRLSGTTYMAAIPADTTLSLTASKRTRISFTFDGVKWQQDAISVENQ